MTSRRRMRTRGAGGGGGTVIITPPGDCPPTGEWPDSFSLRDQMNIMRALFHDTVAFGDTPSMKTAIADTFGLGDAASAAILAQWLDTFGMDDQVGVKPTLFDTLGFTDNPGLQPDLFDTFRVIDDIGAVKVGGLVENCRLNDELIATITDTVILGDSWTDEANTGVNHGTDTGLSVKANLAVGAQGADAYFKFNLRNQLSTDPLFGMSSLPDTFLTFKVTSQSNSALVAETISVHSLVGTSDPWNENTITWANAPAHNTSEDAFSVPAGIGVNQHTVVTTTEMDVLLGNWVSLRLRNESLLSTATVAFSSREFATSKPTVSFQVFT